MNAIIPRKSEKWNTHPDMDIYKKEPTQAIYCAARPRNFYLKFGLKSSVASKAPSVVSL